MKSLHNQCVPQFHSREFIRAIDDLLYLFGNESVKPLTKCLTKCLMGNSDLTFPLNFVKVLAFDGQKERRNYKVVVRARGVLSKYLKNKRVRNEPLPQGLSPERGCALRCPKDFCSLPRSCSWFPLLWLDAGGKKQKRTRSLRRLPLVVF